MYMMMDPTDIAKYLVDDTVFKKLNRQFITLDPDDVRNNNQYLNEIIEKLIKLMQQQSKLFNKTYRRIVWAGSYYKKTRVGDPEEYDINLVIDLPIKQEDMKFTSQCPGYVKILSNIKWDNSFGKSMDPEYQEMKKLIDDESYLHQVKFRTWMEGILDKVARANSDTTRVANCDEIVLPVCGNLNVTDKIKQDKEEKRPRKQFRQTSTSSEEKLVMSKVSDSRKIQASFKILSYTRGKFSMSFCELIVLSLRLIKKHLGYLSLFNIIFLV
ncbi:hypothetical protein X777_14420 [Ooceraea biroi]|uniref:Mab-21-like nucleotidyltransferase domain-containing protein n=1 Tax=Ooceraea biroi TaxID=2015173 RepID=A0A026VYV7_OOCBI|nr:hypothetical protein X777_14420 [Ooceraea biroi]